MDIERIKRLPIRQVVEFYGVNFGSDNKAQCCFHDDTHPSASIKHNRYHCYVCNLHLDTIDFVMCLYKLDFKQAILKMTIDFGIADEFQSYHDRDESRRKRQEQARQKQQERDEINRLCSIHCTLHQMAKVSEPGSIVWCFSTELIDYVSYRIEALQCRKTD